MKKIKFQILLLLTLIISIVAMNNIQATNENSTPQLNPKYLIVKIDDFGYGNWNDTLQAFQNNPKFVADIGVIGYRLQHDSINQHILTELLATGRIDIFNHGWDHEIPEFQNHTVNYMVNHINLWNQFMYERYGVKNEFILGAPGNAIGNTHNCSEPVYQAMNETGYKILYFSYCGGNTNDGHAGLDIPYLYVENDCAAGCTFNLTSYANIEQGIKNLAQDPVMYVQVHFTAGHYWNYTTITKFLNFMYTQSGRVGITMTDYYNQIFLPNHPSYFLRNNTNQFINSETAIQTTTHTKANSETTATTITNSSVVSTGINLNNQLLVASIVIYSVLATIVIVLLTIKRVRV